MILKLKTEENKSEKEIAKDPQIRDLYAALFDKERDFKRNINDYLKNPSPKNKNAEREKEYAEYLEKNPFKLYTRGKRSTITDFKISQLSRGIQIDPTYTKKAETQADTGGTKIEETKSIEQEGKEGDAVKLTDQAVIDEIAKPVPAPAPAPAPTPAPSGPRIEPTPAPAPAPTPTTSPYMAPTGTDGRNKEKGETSTQYLERMRKEEEAREASKRQQEREAQALAKARETLKGWTPSMGGAVLGYTVVNENDQIAERQREAEAKMIQEYGTQYPAGLTEQEKKNLLTVFMHNAITEQSAQQSIKGAEHEDKPTETPEESPPENIPEFGDEDGDGQITRADYFKKFGGGTRGQGKATEEEIAEGVRRAIQEDQGAKQYRERQQVLNPEAREDPNVREEQVGTAFTGAQAGIDQEFFYDEAQSGRPTMTITRDQPATDLKTSILDKFEQNTEDAGQIMEDKTRREKTLEQLKQELRCFHILYEDKIKSIKDPEHIALYTEALNSDDLKTVREHHKLMADLIRAYYKVSHLKLGVIMSAESVFGGAIGNIPAMLGSFGMGVPIQRGNEQPTRIDRKKGKDRYSNATAGEINVIRGGRNSKKGVRQAIPRDIDKNKYIDDIPFPNYEIADAFRPRSYMRRRVHTNPEIRIKSGKTRR